MLSHLLVSEMFAFLLVFCRLGSAIMLLPGFGEAYVPARARLLLAAMFSVVVAPVVHALPTVPGTVFGLFTLMLAEILVGLFLGGLSRMLIATIHIAGVVIAYQSSLSSALTQDIAIAQSQGTSLGNMLSISALVILFSTDLHHLMLRGLVDSYTLFLPGTFPNVEDFAGHATQTLNSSFRMATQIAGPHIVVGLMLYLGAGVISRVVPNIQVFFIMMAPQLLISFFILMISFSTMMMWYMDYFKDTLGGFMAP